ncbi:MAG TPA: glycosyltransferase [Candidatus Aquicultor sp.]|jgi:glycosyltransferase involved in cell wall biosynthesis
MVRKKALIACSNYWNSPCQVGSHHLARGFVAAGWDVAFISHPISPLHFMGTTSRELSERLEIYRSGGQYYLDGHLWTYVPGALLAPHNKHILRSEWVHRNWASLTYPNVIKKIYDAGFGDVDLLYFDNPNQLFLLEAIKYKTAIFRIVDNNSGYERATHAVLAMESELARSVGLVIYTAESLKEHVEEMQPKAMLHVPNGVNFKHFAEGSKAQPTDLATTPRPIAIYVGALNSWFDHTLINWAAEQLPQVSFAIIGPDEGARSKIAELSNIHVLGKRSYDDLPAYLHNADVGIIPFNAREHADLVNSIHPLKLYEYMACGLPVVSAEWDEIKNINSPAYLYNSREQFLQQLQAAVAKPQDRDSLIRYAAAADWSARVEIILNEIEHLPK